MKKSELEAKGVNFDNLKEPFGDANIITRFRAAKQKKTEDYSTRIRMDVYMPRKTAYGNARTTICLMPKTEKLL